MKKSVDEVKKSVAKLQGLLDAGEAGLMSWHDAVERQIDEIAELSTFKAAADDALRLLEQLPDAASRRWVEKYRKLTGT